MGKSKEDNEEILFDPAVDYPLVNAVLCATMVLLVPWIFISVLTTTASRVLFIQCVVGVATFIWATERLAERVGVWLSTGPLAGPPFNNPLSVTADLRSTSKGMVKFKAQLWQLIVHVGLAILERKTLADLTRNGQDDWWSKATYMFEGQGENGFLLELLYVLQLAVWFVTGFFQVFVFERVRDHLVMLAHHAATILLLGLSYQHGYMRLGLMVIYIHDVTDIVIDVLKLSNGLQLEGLRGGFLVEASFMGTLVSWFYYRLYLLPKSVIYQAAYRGTTCAYWWYMNMDGTLTAASLPSTHMSENMCWDGSVEAGRNADVLAKSTSTEQAALSQLSAAAVATLLLAVLFAMHIYWYLLFVRIAVKLLNGMEGHDVGEQEYEGSDGPTAVAPADLSKKRD